MKKDIITKTIIKEIAVDLSKYILNIDVGYDIELLESEFDRVEKREADILFKNKDEIIHIEIQNSNDYSMHLRMLRYFSDIKFAYKDSLVKQYVIYIGKKSCKLPTQIKQENINYRYNLIDLKKLNCEVLLNHSEPAAVALSILCDFKDKDEQLVVNTILKRLKELTKEDSFSFRRYLKMVEVLSENRDLKESVKKGEEMLVVDIEKMPSYEIGYERGIHQGISQGISQGITQGITQGISQGINIGEIQRAKIIAKNLLLAGIDIEIIKKTTNLPKEEIEKLLLKQQ